MIPNIVRGSNPAGLIEYLFGPGRHNEHANQHLVCASGDMLKAFDTNGRPIESFGRIGCMLDRRYRVRARKDDPFPPDMRGRNNPGKERGKNRIWHCSLSIKAAHGVMSDQQWEDIVRDYLRRMNLLGNDRTGDLSWIAVRHGLSRNGNDHVHLVVQLAGDGDWVNPFNDFKHAQRACRRIEESHDDLVELDKSLTDPLVRFKFAQWRRWAEWKCANERDDWTSMDDDERSRRIAMVAATTMPKYAVARIVEACAKSSRSEDEFIRRVRREGLNIDPRLRKGVRKGEFTDPDQVTGYRITWRSSDGWRERFNAADLGEDVRLKSLRAGWVHDARSEALAVQEWRASMENRPPVVCDGRERHPRNLSAHDMNRLVEEAWSVAVGLADKHGAEYDRAVRDGLRRFDELRERYGLDDAESSVARALLDAGMTMPDPQRESGIGR